MERHRQAVSKIATAVRGFFDRREPYRIFHGSTNSTRPSQLKTGGVGVVDISALDQVLSVDRATRTALVEPNVPMDRLVEATLPHGLVPPVVMEFPGITAGGGYAGTAGESSSFRHGFFDETINSVEMVLGDGRVVRAASSTAATATATATGDDDDGDDGSKQRSDLFHGAAGAVGTLGVTTLLELRLVEAARYVETTYHRTNSVREAVARVRAETEDPRNDYVDAILFAKDHGVVVTGRRTDHLPAGRTPQTFSHARDPWFYLHARDRTSLSSSRRHHESSAATITTTKTKTTPPPSPSHTDYVPLAEYLFRYDRAGFWVGAQGWTYFKLIPFNRWTRWLLDDFVHTRMMYRALHASGESARFVVQDLALPYPAAETFVDFAVETFDIWPLWLCPLKASPSTSSTTSSITPRPTFHPYTGVTEPAGTTAATASYSLFPFSSSSPAAAPTAADGEPSSDTTTTTTTTTTPQQLAPMLNIGLWGWGPANHDEFVAKNRALEARLRALGGRKWLYAHTYYGADDFWRIYDSHHDDHDDHDDHHNQQPSWYAALRAKYAATTLPSVHDKVRIDVDAARRRRHETAQSIKGRWPFGGLYGIWRAIRSGDYHLHRKAQWKYKPEK